MIKVDFVRQPLIINNVLQAINKTERTLNVRFVSQDDSLGSLEAWPALFVVLG
jgi:hypothetical protein